MSTARASIVVVVKKTPSRLHCTRIHHCYTLGKSNQQNDQNAKRTALYSQFRRGFRCAWKQLVFTGAAWHLKGGLIGLGFRGWTPWRRGCVRDAGSRKFLPWRRSGQAGREGLPCGSHLTHSTAAALNKAEGDAFVLEIVFHVTSHRSGHTAKRSPTNERSATESCSFSSWRCRQPCVLAIQIKVNFTKQKNNDEFEQM